MSVLRQSVGGAGADSNVIRKAREVASEALAPNEIEPLKTTSSIPAFLEGTGNTITFASDRGER